MFYFIFYGVYIYLLLMHLRFFSYSIEMAFIFYLPLNIIHSFQSRDLHKEAEFSGNSENDFWKSSHLIYFLKDR